MVRKDARVGKGGGITNERKEGAAGLVGESTDGAVGTGAGCDEWPMAEAVAEITACNENVVGFHVHHTKLDSTLPVGFRLHCANRSAALSTERDAFP
jgi:hypothetical protein